MEIGSEIIALLRADAHLVAVGEDGMVALLDRDTFQLQRQERRAARLRAAAILPWLDSTRLLLAGEEGSVQCLGLDDPLVTHYASSYRGLRALAASATMVAAVSPDRQRLILWNSWDTRQPAAELFLTSLTRHRIADIAV
jgi:hypothetical protein